MDSEALRKKLFETALITGQFRLRSGRVANEYFDKYRFEADPRILAEVARHLVPLLPEKTEVLAGLELGGVPIATALSIETGHSAAFVRKEAKEYGTCQLAEGANIVGKQLTVIEDVVTTGGAVLESVQKLREFGGIVDTAICVVLRDKTALSNFDAEGIELRYLFHMD